jgi:hypothetical protein
VAQLGARFHGMEEVVGSIPTRSTKQSNNLANANLLSGGICVTVCVITRHSAACGEGFHCCALRFHTDVGVPLQHTAADVAGDGHDGRVRRSALCKLSNGAVPQVMEPKAGESGLLCQCPPSGTPAIQRLGGIELRYGVVDDPLAASMLHLRVRVTR